MPIGNGFVNLSVMQQRDIKVSLQHFSTEEHYNYIQSYRLYKVQTVTKALKHVALVYVFLSA